MLYPIYVYFILLFQLQSDDCAPQIFSHDFWMDLAETIITLQLYNYNYNNYYLIIIVYNQEVQLKYYMYVCNTNVTLMKGGKT